MDRYAPVCLFAYKRIDKLKIVVERLKKCYLADETVLFIFSDGARDTDDLVDIDKTRQYLRKIDGFSKVIIIERKKNIGLAENIMQGVTEVISKYKKTIIIEDDIVPNLYFLEYMNSALDYYESSKKVMQICANSLPPDSEKKSLPQTYFMPWGSCWGWATWDDRWKFFERNPQKLINIVTEEDIYRINRNGTYNMWQQVLDNYSGKRKTWAIFWEITIYLHHGLSLYPNVDMCKNIGMDGKGENCPIDIRYPKKTLIDAKITEFSDVIEENNDAMELTMKWGKKVNRPLSFWQKCYYVLFIENKKEVLKNVYKKFLG